MTIGTSLGNHYQDEHHYQARSFTPFPGFHQSGNVEDRRQEFFDPRTDPVYRDRNEDESLLGGYMSKDLDPYDEQYTKLGGELGVADLMVASAKQVKDRRLMLEEQTKMEDELAAAEKKAGVTPEDSGLPGDEWKQWNEPLPKYKTDQQIRDEAKEMAE